MSVFSDATCIHKIASYENKLRIITFAGTPSLVLVNNLLLRRPRVVLWKGGSLGEEEGGCQSCAESTHWEGIIDERDGD